MEFYIVKTNCGGMTKEFLYFQNRELAEKAKTQLEYRYKPLYPEGEVIVYMYTGHFSDDSFFA